MSMGLGSERSSDVVRIPCEKSARSLLRAGFSRATVPSCGKCRWACAPPRPSRLYRAILRGVPSCHMALAVPSQLSCAKLWDSREPRPSHHGVRVATEPAFASPAGGAGAARKALLAFWPAIFAGIVAQKMWMHTTVPSVYTSQAVFLWLMPSKSLVPNL